MQNPFQPGQRWVSDAEPDLGLGSVEQADLRYVTIRFAASGQRRTYALAGAPLSRVRFAPQDSIEDRNGTTLTVYGVDEIDGLLSYHCADESGGRHLVPEDALSDHLHLNRPQDRLLARRVDPDIWFTLRYRTWLQSAALWQSPVYGLQGPRIELIPHQLYIASEVAGRQAPRVLLADEVGLGKTIEAGLILHRLIITERVQRVLVVLPEPLVHQWLVEMLRRFNLPFAVFDEERIASTGVGNPFLTEQRVLCSLSLLIGSEHAAGAAVDGEWDLLIVDEAHHLAWTEEGGSAAYRLVEALAARVPSVLLLTATPEQLGRAGHFGRLRLLDPQRYHDYAAFVAEEREYGPVAALAGHLLDAQPLGAGEHELLVRLLGDEATLPPQLLIDRLIDRHGTGRVLFRNTRHAISGFPQRRLHVYPLARPAAYANRAAVPCPETHFDHGWTAIDPRVGWLLDLLRRLAPRKVLVICAYADTALALRNHLVERHALRVALFHERMEIVERDRAAAFFADADGGAQVLICSEIGSEGRNFQFAHHLVLFDLPNGPDLLEQRIGRLDRIGQRDTVELHVPYLQGAAGEVLMRWYRDGLGSFEAVCPAATEVHAQLADALRDALADPLRTDALVADAAELTARINAELEAGRDRLLELHSHRPDRAEILMRALRDTREATPLPTYMEAYWDAFGVEHEPGAGRGIVLQPGGHMLHEHFPGLAGDPMTVTFDRADALAQEDRQFLTWEHPMVRGSMEMLTSGELGGAAVTVCSHPDFRTGTVFIETLFVFECPAPPGLEVQRFLPPTCRRLLLDAQGRDRTDELAHEQLQGLCLSQNRKLADTVIKSQAERIPVLLRLAEDSVTSIGVGVAQHAEQAMRAEIDAELLRLRALAKVNPNVRQDEIDRLLSRRDQLAKHLGAARLRLDAVRLIVMR